jgi:hypothetical protein
MSYFEKELELCRAAVRLRAASPTAWDDFVISLANYSTEVTRLCISSAPDVLLREQGKAQAVALLVGTLHEAPATVERMAQKGK